MLLKIIVSYLRLVVHGRTNYKFTESVRLKNLMI